MMFYHTATLFNITADDYECTLRSGLGGTDTVTTLPWAPLIPGDLVSI